MAARITSWGQYFGFAEARKSAIWSELSYHDARFFEGRVVACLGCLQQLHGDADVAVQERGELVAGRIAVEGLDRVADVDLVSQQAGGGGVRAADPSAKVTIASRVQVTWSSQSLRIWSWKAAWVAVRTGVAEDETA